jgi:hypothetical protein
VSWLSKKQPTVALSTTEAEYRAAAQATCETTWMEMLFKDLKIKVQRPLVIYSDTTRDLSVCCEICREICSAEDHNLSSILLAKNPNFHARTKHIEVHYHFI